MATFYVASKFENKRKVAALQRLLRKMGHSITHDWTAQSDAYNQHAPRHAQEDMDGVVACTDFVALFDEPLPYLNAYVELGVALALKKHVYIIGACDAKCIFSKLPNVQRFTTLYDFIEVARGLP